METITEFIANILTPIVDLGPLFMIFVVFTFIGLLVRLGPVRAFRNGLMISVGFSGVYIIVDYFLAEVAPAALALAERFGGVFTYTDIGWAAFASFAFSSPFAYGVIALSLVINLVMITLNLTDTLNLNIWDTWEATIGTLIVYGITGNILVSFLFAGMMLWITLMVCDWYAHKGYPEKFYNFPNITFYQGFNSIWGMFGHACAKILDKIPWTSQAKFTPELIQEKYGVIGEPAVLGGIIGLLMGIGAGFEWGQVVMLMISLATALVLLPRMSGIVMEALVPVSEAAADFMRKRTHGKSLFIGVDPAIAVGHTTVLAVTVLMVPILIIMSLIIPGAVNVPLADLPALLFMWVYVAAPNKGDLLRTLITAIVMGFLGIFASMKVAPWLSMVAVNSGVSVPPGTGVTSWFGHLDPTFLPAGLIGEALPTIGTVGVVIIVAVVVAGSTAIRLNYNMRKKRELAVLASAD